MGDWKGDFNWWSDKETSDAHGDTGYLNKYCPSGHVPNSAPVRKLYGTAIKELRFPAPSTPLNNYPQLSGITGGFRPYEFSILCGSTGSGKSTLIANWSSSLIMQGVPHFVASVETGHTDFIRRIISSKRQQDWNTGQSIPQSALEVFHDEFGQQFNTDSMWLSLYDNRFSIETLMADISYHVANHGVKVAFIDNLNFFMEVTKSADSVVEMDRVIHELIIFCKQVPVHVVMIMHPKKTDHGRVESEFDIKGSSTAVQEAHNVFLFNRPHQDIINSGGATSNDREIKIAKMRRIGRGVGKRLILKCNDGVSYYEGDGIW